jgi:hypothetical protein
MKTTTRYKTYLIPQVNEVVKDRDLFDNIFVPSDIYKEEEWTKNRIDYLFKKWDVSFWETI